VARHPDERPELAATDTAAPVGPQTEEELGATLLTLVASARTMGLDSERALRSALRVLQEEIRGAEAGAESAAR
jgi:XTP/dITP diphosphohydrolase